MRFEQALQAMREGKKVRLKGQPNEYSIVDGKIWVEYADFLDNIQFAPHTGFPCYTIMSEDWEVVEDEQKS